MSDRGPPSPRVSVVLPTYNRAHLVGRAVESVLTQTFEDLELLVVDDGSEDDTASFLSSFSDPRLVVLLHDTNRGGAAARNTAIDVSRGEFIAFLDSDCEYLPDHLAAVVARFDEDESGEIGVVVVDHLRVTDGVEEVRPAGHIDRDALLWLERNIASSATVIRRGCLQEGLRFDEEIEDIDDRRFFMAIGERYRFATIDRPLVRFRHHDGPHMNVPATQLALRQRLMTEHGDEIERQPRLLARHQLALGHLHLELGDDRAARRAFTASARAWPYGWRAWTWYAVALLGPRSTSVRSALKRASRRLRSIRSRSIG